MQSFSGNPISKVLEQFQILKLTVFKKMFWFEAKKVTFGAKV